MVVGASLLADRGQRHHTGAFPWHSLPLPIACRHVNYIATLQRRRRQPAPHLAGKLLPGGLLLAEAHDREGTSAQFVAQVVQVPKLHVLAQLACGKHAGNRKQRSLLALQRTMTMCRIPVCCLLDPACSGNGRVGNARDCKRCNRQHRRLMRYGQCWGLGTGHVSCSGISRVSGGRTACEHSVAKVHAIDCVCMSFAVQRCEANAGYWDEPRLHA